MNSQPRMLKQKTIVKLRIKSNAAVRIQAAWRIFTQKRDEALRKWEEEQEKYEQSYGCGCGDWICPGCTDGPFNSCRECGDDSRCGDYDMWGFCSRSCMVSASRRESRG